MVIDTGIRIWAFVLTVTCVAMVFAVGINFVVFPADILAQTIRGTMIIVPIVAMPICVFIAMQMREKALISQQLRDLVNRDRLTDAATRDFFFNRLKAMPGSYGVSLMVDIDHFKDVNDTHGHLAGDVVIMAVAAKLKAQMRSDDIVCRFGGEEFVIFLKSATAVDGKRIAERIRKSVENTSTFFEGDEIKVTVSLGGSMKDQMEHIDAAIKRADDCLYLAKRQGRNRAVLDWDDIPRRMPVSAVAV